jgi:hypothetical protein
MPKMLHTVKVAAQIKKVEAMDDAVYARKITDNVTPFKPAYNKKSPVAVDACTF